MPYFEESPPDQLRELLKLIGNPETTIGALSLAYSRLDRGDAVLMANAIQVLQGSRHALSAPS